MKLKLVLIQAALGLTMTLGFAVSTQAGDAKAGEAKAGLCAGCHGPQGISFAPDIPNLAGQKEVYLAKAIKDYRSNKRKNPMMNSMAANLTDADVDNLAAFYSGLKAN